MIAVVSSGALVALGEPVTISLLRRAAALDVPNERSSRTILTSRSRVGRCSTPSAGRTEDPALTRNSPFGVMIAAPPVPSRTDEPSQPSLWRCLSTCTWCAWARSMGLSLQADAVAAEGQAN
jgi:hypothetical protein